MPKCQFVSGAIGAHKYSLNQKLLLFGGWIGPLALFLCTSWPLLQSARPASTVMPCSRVRFVLGEAQWTTLLPSGCVHYVSSQRIRTQRVAARFVVPCTDGPCSASLPYWAQHLWSQSPTHLRTRHRCPTEPHTVPWQRRWERQRVLLGSFARLLGAAVVVVAGGSPRLLRLCSSPRLHGGVLD